MTHKVGEVMGAEASAMCAECQQRIAAIMMEVQMRAGGSAVPMSALVNVLAYGMAHLFDTTDEAMAHLQKVLRPEIEMHIANGVRQNGFVVEPVEAGHA